MNDSLEINFDAHSANIKIFNNALWRQLLNTTCNHLENQLNGLPVNAISPWGFEVIQDKKYLSKHLRRFYCYIGVPRQLENKINRKEIASQFGRVLLEKLEEINAKMAKDFVVMIEQDHLKLLKNSGYICQSTDKLLDIQVRFTDNVLEDYANYLIATLDAISSDKGMFIAIGKECSYKTNQAVRWRMYQLYVIQESLFGHLLPSFTDEELKLYKSIFLLSENMIQLFYSPDEMFKKMNPWEEYVIENLIKPRIEKICNIIQAPTNDKVRIELDSYHINDKLQLDIERKHYESALEKVKRTYLEFV